MVLGGGGANRPPIFHRTTGAQFRDAGGGYQRLRLFVSLSWFDHIMSQHEETDKSKIKSACNQERRLIIIIIVHNNILPSHHHAIKTMMIKAYWSLGNGLWHARVWLLLEQQHHHHHYHHQTSFLVSCHSPAWWVFYPCERRHKRLGERERSLCVFLYLSEIYRLRPIFLTGLERDREPKTHPQPPRN